MQLNRLPAANQVQINCQSMRNHLRLFLLRSICPLAGMVAFEQLPEWATFATGLQPAGGWRWHHPKEN
jgi:hypothetical protein